MEWLKKRIYHVDMISESEVKTNFGLVVRQLREQKGLTREKLAEYLDLQPQTISSIENGTNFVSCEVLVKISNYFEISPACFFVKKIKVCKENNIDTIAEIKSMLPFFDSEKQKEILDILRVFAKY